MHGLFYEIRPTSWQGCMGLHKKCVDNSNLACIVSANVLAEHTMGILSQCRKSFTRTEPT